MGEWFFFSSKSMNIYSYILYTCFTHVLTICVPFLFFSCNKCLWEANFDISLTIVTIMDVPDKLVELMNALEKKSTASSAIACPVSEALWKIKWKKVDYSSELGIRRIMYIGADCNGCHVELTGELVCWSPYYGVSFSYLLHQKNRILGSLLETKHLLSVLIWFWDPDDSFNWYQDIKKIITQPISLLMKDCVFCPWWICDNLLLFDSP